VTGFTNERLSHRALTDGSDRFSISMIEIPQ